MKTVVLIGGSGVVGARVLAHLLGHGEVGRVIALGRRLLSVEHEKLVSKVVDLNSPESVGREIADDAAIAVSCLWTTMKQAGSQEAFRSVDRDAVLAFGQAALDRGAERFLLVSSLGADAQSRNFYLKTKGETEAALAQLGYPQLTVLRPSFIDDQGARVEYRLAERIGLPICRALFSIVGRTSRYAPIRADTIAKALVHLAFDQTAERVRFVESDRLHVLGR